MRNVYSNWIIPLGRPSHRWEANITMDFKETGCQGKDLIQVAQYGMNGRLL